MKQRILTSVLLLFFGSVIISAQSTMLWDGESHSIGSRGGCWADGSPTVVSNPDRSSINPSEKCLMFAMTNSSKTIKIPFRNWVKPAMNGSKRISLMIRKAQNENVLIEVSDPTNGSAAYWQKVAAWYGGNGEWEKVVFDFSSNDSFDYPGLLSITAQTADVNGTQTVYIDNVQIEGATVVNGTSLTAIPNGTLRGHLLFGGSWAAGSCSNANNERNWKNVSYDDFALLAQKLSVHATSADLRMASLKNARNVFSQVNPNMLVFTNAPFSQAVYDPQGTTHWVGTTEQGGLSTYFTPIDGCVGDPFPFYDQQGHMFRIAFLKEQHPNPPTYHPIHMVTSPQLTTFNDLGTVVACGQERSQEHALGTGCIFQKDGIYYLFYTGHNDYYATTGGYKEVILRASSTDGEHWSKDNGFRLQSPLGTVPNDYDANEFRDPHIFEYEGKYHMVVSALKNGRPVVAHFISQNLWDWSLGTPLLSDMNSFYECIDIFSMNGRFYMVYSDIDSRRVYYRWSESLYGPWAAPKALDGTSFYAGKTMWDGYDRYMAGWCATRVNNDNVGTQDWGGALVVHKLYEAQPGELALTIPHTVEAKHDVLLPVQPSVLHLTTGSQQNYDRLNYQNLISAEFTAADNTHEVFGFAFADCSDTDARYSIRLNLNDQKIYFNKDYKNGNVVEINQMVLPRSGDGRYRIRVSIELSVCVVYINDRIAFTNRIYGIARNPWSIFCERGTVNMDRLKVSTY